MDLRNVIRTIPNFPKEGIMFRDITSLIENPKAFEFCINQFKEKFANQGINKIAGIESRGFVFGSVLAKEMGLPFVLIRKKGKLPGKTVSQSYDLEYGSDMIEVHINSINEGESVLVIDDLIATGGTAAAACSLVEKVGGKVAGCAFVINLPELNGCKKLEKYDVTCLVEFEGE